MKARNLLTTSVFILIVSIIQIYSVENSIIPQMEKYEIITNIPQNKFSSSQYAEICDALNQTDQKIRLVSYNMLFNLYDHNLPEIHRWPQRQKRVVELIKDMQPDIMGVQELYKDQLEDLIAQIGEEYEFYTKPAEDGELNGIFYRIDRFEVLEKKVWYMTPTPDVPSSETLTLLKMKDQVSGATFAVFNSHFAFSNIEKRDFQARFVVKNLEPYAQQMPVFLTGDLNTFPARLDLEKFPFYDGDYINRILTQSSLRDAKELSLLGHLGPISTFTNDPQDVLPFKGLGTPGVFLDHIYTTKDVKVLLHAVQPGTVDGEFPSDHLPLIVDFLLPQQE